MPICSRCEKSRRLSSFFKRPNGTRYYHCKWCQRKYNRSHYENNKQYYNDKARRNDAVREKPILEYLLKCKDVPCKDCGGKFEHFQMDFDHVFGKKLFPLSLFRTNGGCSMRKVVAEVAKCEVVCSNCHRKRTWERSHLRGSTPLGSTKSP